MNGEPSRQDVLVGVQDALGEDGYLLPEGARDLPAMRDAIYAPVSQARVTTRKERPKTAITRSRMVGMVCPSLPGPDAWDDQDSPRLAELVYNEVSNLVWRQLDPDGQIQRRVGEIEDGRYALCRTKVTDDRLDAVYITKAPDLIRLDLTGPLSTKADQLARKHAKIGVMLVERQPDNGKKFLADFRAGMRTALTSGEDPIKLAIEAVTDNGSEASTADVEDDVEAGVDSE